MKALIISSSPRRDGNSSILAREVYQGVLEAGNDAQFAFSDDVVSAFLRDCRTCRRPDGECSIGDHYRDFFFKQVLSAEGLIFSTPVYWYGMSAQLKAFFDRMFCYVAASHPKSEDVISQLLHKRIGLVLSSEETFPTVAAGIVHQIQEFSNYTRSEFVGYIHGHGNARGDVRRDPTDPLEKSRRFGLSFFDAVSTNYTIDAERGGKMWSQVSQ